MAATNPKLEKLEKKLKKAQAEGDEEAVATLQKKLKKLQKKAAESEEEGASTPSKKRGLESGASEDGEGEEEPKKKSKKAKAAKSTATTSDEDMTNAEDEEEEGEGKKKKKEKKEKGINYSAQGGASIAQVGDHDLAKAGKTIRKQLYKEHAEVAAMSADKVVELRRERCTTVEGPGIKADQVGGMFKPLLKFEHTGLAGNMLHATREFVSPSPIQSQVWPIILAGHDLIGIAATGSGKTLGFGLPMLAHIAAQREAGVVGSGKGPFAMVMAPTRELALQINQVIHDAGSKCGIRSVCVYGGVPKKEQVDALRRGVEVVVGTPGRLEDLMNDGVCRLNEVTYLVLDEADRMLDLGFEPHIRAICSKVRADRQTLMFSATWPTAVQKLAAAFLATPIKVTIGSQDLAASHSITQHVEVIEPQARDDRLLQLLSKYHSSRTNRIIIFVLYKKEAPRVESLLNRRGWKCAAIHGDISQGQRTAAVEGFKSGKVPLLIATDVAARGLDIPDVEVVINYSFPLTTEDYVHRIGRTGRAGKKGTAHTFFCAGADKPRAGELINVLREAGQTVPEDLLKFGTAVKKKESKLYGSHFKDVDINAKATKVTFDSDDDE